MGRPRRRDSIRDLIEKVLVQFPMICCDKEKARSLVNYLVLKKSFPDDIIHRGEVLSYNLEKETSAISLVAYSLFLRILGLTPEEISCFLKGKDRVYLIRRIESCISLIGKQKKLNDFLIEKREGILAVIKDFDLNNPLEIFELARENGVLVRFTS